MSTRNTLRKQRAKKLAATQKITIQDEPIEETPTKVNYDTVSYQDIINIFNRLNRDITNFIKDNDGFKTRSDKVKIDTITSQFGIQKLYEKHPVVMRYMICSGEFSSAAFKKYMDAYVLHEKNKMNPKAKPGDNEDRWCMLNANYVVDTYVDYHPNQRHNDAKKKMIRQNAYDLLKKDFTDFRDDYKKQEKKVKDDQKLYHGRNMKEALNFVLKHDANKMTDETRQRIFDNLTKARTFKNFNIVMKQLKATREVIAPVREARGQLNEEEAKRRERQQITMIETVDAERMAEIPDKYKPEELRGMQAIPEELPTIVQNIDSVEDIPFN